MARHILPVSATSAPARRARMAASIAVSMASRSRRRMPSTRSPEARQRSGSGLRERKQREADRGACDRPRDRLDAGIRARSDFTYRNTFRRNSGECAVGLVFVPRTSVVAARGVAGGNGVPFRLGGKLSRRPYGSDCRYHRRHGSKADRSSSRGTAERDPVLALRLHPRGRDRPHRAVLTVFISILYCIMLDDAKQSQATTRC